MTQKEKAKAYDEAIIKAKELYNQGLINPPLEHIFPELKESEYERIRKGMLQGFKDYGEPEYVWWEGVKVKECIAWLEKQGERPTPIDIDKMVYKYGNTKEDCTNGLPVNCQIRAYRQGINDTLNLVSNLEKQGEQKPAWSEEDEEMLDDAIGAINAADYYTYDDKQEIGNWLKSLKKDYNNKKRRK